MIDEPRVIPAENVIAAPINVRIFGELQARIFRQLRKPGGSETLVEGIENPRKGASRKRSRGENSPADPGADETEFGIWMDHSRTEIRHRKWSDQAIPRLTILSTT